jgi:hypothetical protein
MTVPSRTLCEQHERLSTESAERLLGYWQASQVRQELH